jgi:hypothetical protein
VIAGERTPVNQAAIVGPVGALKMECRDGHGAGPKRKHSRQSARDDDRQEARENYAYQMLPGVVLGGVGAEPRPPDKRDNDSAFEQIVAADHVTNESKLQEWRANEFRKVMIDESKEFMNISVLDSVEENSVVH